MTGWRIQGLRYAAVGVLSNTLLYALYLLSTNAGVGHKTAMTALFLVGMLQTYVFNRCWTFNYRGRVPGSLARYLMAYGSSYLLNLVALYLFVDKLGYHHALIQAIAVAVIAATLFLVQSTWVFQTPRTGTLDVGGAA